MKKIINSALALLCFSAAICSINGEIFDGSRGNIWLGGSFGFETMGMNYKDAEDGDKNRTNILSISPTLRFFPANHFSLGPKISWLGMFMKNSSSNYSMSYGMNVWGFGGEFGFVYGTERVIPFAFIAPQFGITRLKDTYESLYSSSTSESDDTTMNSFLLPINAGVIIPVGSNIGIQIETGIRFTFNDEYTANTFFIGIGICGLGEKTAVSAVNYLSSFASFY